MRNRIHDAGKYHCTAVRYDYSRYNILDAYTRFADGVLKITNH